jgi:hypothetical protein
MRLKFDPFDGRKWNTRDIIDEDTGKHVGHIRSSGVGFTKAASIFHYSTTNIERPSAATKSVVALYGAFKQF